MFLFLLALAFTFAASFHVAAIKFLGQVQDPLPDFKQISVEACRFFLCGFVPCLGLGDLLVEFADVDEAILLLILDKHQFESMRLLLDVIVRRLQLSVQFLELISPIFLFFEDLAMIFVLIGHVLSFLLQLLKFRIFVFDVTLRLRHILLELGVQVDEHVLPVDEVLLTVGEHLAVPLDLLRERLRHVCILTLKRSVRCQHLIVKNPFHFHLLSVGLVTQIVVLLRRVVEVVVIRRRLLFYHRLHLVHLLHQLFIEFFELIPLSDEVLHLLCHRVDVVLLLLDHAVHLVTTDEVTGTFL